MDGISHSTPHATPPLALDALAKQVVISVIGTGAMGAGIAQVAAAAGHPVKLFDSRPLAAEQAVTAIRAQFSRLAEKGKMNPEAAAAAGARLTAVDALAALADSGLVIEAIVEDLSAKQKLYRELELIVGADCFFGTNTSSISITAIGAALQHPQRLAGVHFFNPAPLMALVEIISGLATDERVARSLFATVNAWGKTAVYAKSTPGFIVNRVARPYYGEALRVLNEGGAQAATIDACCREAGGFRMGPFELMDLIGLDVNFAVTKLVWNAFYNDPRFLPSLIQQELVAAGFLGKKTGRGFYDYREGASSPRVSTEVSTETVQTCPETILIYGDSPIAQAFAARLRERQVSFRLVGTSNTDVPLLATAGAAHLYLTDGRTATRRAFDTGIKDIVLIDLALDYQTTSRLATSVATQCSPTSAAQAIGLLQAAGIAVSRLKDLPGLVVMRTLAMLVNEAADAVNQGVCDVHSVDAAMRLGVNYPIGPLAWADKVGLTNISEVLTHLGQAYGEDRYRLSPLIQEKIFSECNFY